MEKSKKNFFSKLGKAIVGKSKVDDEVLDELEEVLVTSDVGVDTTLKIIDRIEARVARDKYMGTDELNSILREEIAGLLSETNTGNDTEITVPEGVKPYVNVRGRLEGLFAREVMYELIAHGEEIDVAGKRMFSIRSNGMTFP